MPARSKPMARTEIQSSHVLVNNDKIPSASFAPPRRKVNRNTGPSARVRKLVWQRDQGACVACGRVITDGMWWSMQHRKARGQGGDNTPSNLILLCGSATSAGCHRRAEDRDREFNARGYWLHSYEDPATTPVMVFSPGGSGCTAWLTADGKYVFEAPAGGAA